MAFDPSCPSPHLPLQLPRQSIDLNLNPNHHQQPSYYNFAYPSSEAMAPAEVTMAQQHYFYPHGGEAGGLPNASVANGGQYYCSIPEIQPIATICMAPPPPQAMHQRQNDTHKRRKAKGNTLKKEAITVQPLQCVVCKISCDTQAVLNCHKQGRQHKKNLQNLKDAITPKPEKTEPEKEPGPEKTEPEKNASEDNLKRQRSKAQPIECEVCNVYCNTIEFLKMHENGKKHKKMAAKLINGGATSNTKPEGDGVMGEPVYCEVCSVRCTSQVDLNIHYQGRNHKKKLMVKPDEEELGAAALKKRKVVDERHALAIRCDLCNVEVNSQIVYESHIAGSKHAAMVKKKLQQLPEEVEAVAVEESTRVKSFSV